MTDDFEPEGLTTKRKAKTAPTPRDSIARELAPGPQPARTPRRRMDEGGAEAGTTSFGDATSVDKAGAKAGAEASATSLGPPPQPFGIDVPKKIFQQRTLTEGDI